MENAQIRVNTNKLLTFVATKFEANELDNQSLVQLIELAGSYLNLKTIADYARSKNLSYQGVKKCRESKELFGVKFVIDNL